MARHSHTARDAAAVGPYSHAIESDPFVFFSGQTPLDPATGRLVDGPIEAQARQCFANLAAVLDAAGLDFGDVVKVNVFLIEMGDFAAMNAVYGQQFDEPYPARTTIGVASLPLEARIEIEMIARTR